MSDWQDEKITVYGEKGWHTSTDSHEFEWLDFLGHSASGMFKKSLQPSLINSKNLSDLKTGLQVYNVGKWNQFIPRYAEDNIACYILSKTEPAAYAVLPKANLHEVGDKIVTADNQFVGVIERVMRPKLSPPRAGIGDHNVSFNKFALALCRIPISIDHSDVTPKVVGIPKVGEFVSTDNLEVRGLITSTSVIYQSEDVWFRNLFTVEWMTAGYMMPSGIVRRKSNGIALGVTLPVEELLALQYFATQTRQSYVSPLNELLLKLNCVLI